MPPRLADRRHPRKRSLRAAARAASIRATLPPYAVIADGLAAVVWVAIALDGLRLARSGPPGGALSRTVLAAALLAGLGAGAALLEGLAGRLPAGPGWTLAGLALLAGGLLLYARARRALGARRRVALAPSAMRAPVTRGPYALVRHPLYAALLVLVAGTVMVHPSLATAALAAGLAAGLVLKMRLEERALRAALGPAWERYAAAVPALLPRPRALLARLAGRAW